MNNEGYGSNGVPFEYTIEKQGKSRTRRRILLILGYAAWVIIFFTAGALLKLILPLLCFIPLSVWFLSWLTWRFTHEEMTVTLFSGAMTVTRKFDGKLPKKLTEVKIKDMECFEPYSEELMEKYKSANVIYATRDNNYAEAYIAAWGDTTVVMEVNEKALKIIKYYR